MTVCKPGLEEATVEDPITGRIAPAVYVWMRQAVDAFPRVKGPRFNRSSHMWRELKRGGVMWRSTEPLRGACVTLLQQALAWTYQHVSHSPATTCLCVSRRRRENGRAATCLPQDPRGPALRAPRQPASLHQARHRLLVYAFLHTKALRQDMRLTHPCARGSRRIPCRQPDRCQGPTQQRR